MDHPLHWPLDAENKWNVSAIFFLEIFRAVQSAIVSRHSQLGVHGLTRPTSAISAKLFIDRPPFQRLHGPPDEMRLSNKNTRKAQAQKKWTRAPTPSSIIYRVPLHGNGGATFPLCCIFQTKGKWPHRRAVLALVHGHRSQLKCRLEVAKNVQQVADDVRSTNGAIATLCKSRSSSYKRKCVTWIFDTQTRWKFHWRLFTCTSTASQIFSCTDHNLRDVLNFWKFQQMYSHSYEACFHLILYFSISFSFSICLSPLIFLCRFLSLCFLFFTYLSSFIYIYFILSTAFSLSIQHVSPHIYFFTAF